MSIFWLNAVSRLLCYPDEELVTDLPELRRALDQADLTPAAKEGISALLNNLATEELLTLQEQYVGLFDRSRRLSLNLFEHVYGDSRARGPAMADLVELYTRNGLLIDTRELPDFLPLYLEFASTRPAAEAKGLLRDAGQVLSKLDERLRKRDSGYAFLFTALLDWSGRPANDGVEEPEEDESFAALDRAWAEAPVAFAADDPSLAQQSCPIASRTVERLKQI